MLEFKEFSKSFGTRKIVEVERMILTKGIYCLKGPNGVGKSTMLKCIAGFLFFEGEILLDRTSLRQQGIAYRRLVNFSDAEPLFPDYLTGDEIVSVFAKSKEALKGQQERYVEGFDMGSYIHQPVCTYSSGMLKKLSLVCAFLGSPRLICMDEPLNALDVDAVSVLCQLMNEIHYAKQTSFLLSSHQDLGLSALDHCHQLQLHHGKIQLI